MLPDDALIERGAAALRGGDRARARELLIAAVRANPRSAPAWLWLAGALDDPAQQRECLERAVALDPASAAARQGLEALRAASREPDPEPPTPNPQPPTPNPQPRLPSPLITIMLAAIGGAWATLAWAAWRGLGAEAGPWAILAIALLAGPPIGWAGLVIGGVLLRTSGRWLGGVGSAGAVRGGLAWAAAPQAAGLLVWAGQLLIIPAASFGGGAATPGQATAATICAGAHGLIALGSAYMAVAGVAAAHRFSLARATAAWLLAALLVLGCLAVIFASSALMITLRGG
jgi:tetratricopeptide (TPR) repeat protein